MYPRLVNLAIRPGIGKTGKARADTKTVCSALAGCGKRVSVILRGAKHLQYLFENKQMQMLRSPQDDSHGDFFRNLADEDGQQTGPRT